MQPDEREPQDPSSLTNQQIDPVDDDARRVDAEGDDDVAAVPAAAAAVPAAPARPSRIGTVLAMAAVAAALTLLWMGSELGDRHVQVVDAPQVSGGGEYEGEAGDELLAGHAAPLQYTLKDMNGVDVQLASFKGKVIVLNFWATWCGPCRAEIPWLVELQTRYPKDLVVLGVEVDGAADKVKSFATEMRMNYPVLLASEREDVQDAYGPLFGIPVSVFVDRSGKIAKKHSGIASKEQFEREIKALL